MTDKGEIFKWEMESGVALFFKKGENEETEKWHRSNHSLGSKEEIPTILCEEGDKNRFGEVMEWKFHCKYCEQFHIHGSVEGFRCAHCHNNTPYDRTGYYLKLNKNQKL